jgi:hypothetical protein
MGLETPVVYAVNSACLEGKVFKNLLFFLTNVQTRRLMSTIARLKLKEIDGNLCKWWGMWFNATIHAKSYQFLY